MALHIRQSFYFFHQPSLAASPNSIRQTIFASMNRTRKSDKPHDNRSMETHLAYQATYTFEQQES
jgi:hypothetical protein